MGRSVSGLGVFALNSLLSRSLLAAGSKGVVNPLHHPAKAKRVIFLYQAGGPSHLETFDYKPKLAGMHGKLIAATEAEIASAAEAAMAALGHPLLARARASARRHREIPVLLPLDGGRTLEGVIDLAFVEDGAWTVVDFKSDVEMAGSQGKYERQAQWYGYALSRLTGMPTTAVLLRV